MAVKISAESSASDDSHRPTNEQIAARSNTHSSFDAVHSAFVRVLLRHCNFEYISFVG